MVKVFSVVLFFAVNLKAGIIYQSYWQPCTVTISWTSGASPTTMCRRDFGNLEIDGRITASALSLTLPTGYTIDTTKLAGSTTSKRPLGFSRAIDTGVQNYGPSNIVYLSTTAVSFWSTNAASTSLVEPNNITNTNPFTFNNTDTVEFYFSVPIVQ
jgi:hypothetical protein